MFVRVTESRHVRDYVLHLRFSDGAEGEVDLRHRIVARPGLLADLADVELFRQVRVDPEAGTIVWPNGVDFCPDVLYHEATGAPLPAGAAHQASVLAPTS